VMPNQVPNVPNGQPPAEFSQPQLTRPSSISLQRVNAPGGMVLPEAVNDQSTMPLPAVPTFRPSKEEFQNAQILVNNMKQQFMNDDRDHGAGIVVPEAELVEWRREFETAHKQAANLEKHFAAIVIIFRDQGLIGRLVASTAMIMRQQNKLQHNPPSYNLGLQNLRQINLFLRQNTLRFKDAVARLQRGERLPQHIPEPGLVQSTMPLPAVPTFRPSKEEFQNAQILVNNMKQQFINDERNHGAGTVVPEAELVEWRREFETAHKKAADLEKHFSAIVILILIAVTAIRILS